MRGIDALDRSVPVAWVAAIVTAGAAWQVLSLFKAGPAELTVVIPLFTPGLIFVPVAIEVRQDLIVADKGQRAWGALLARLLPQAYRGIGVS